ncbi:MAG TPA: DMT family transporter [Rubrobacteraceae bacterium]|nr:DMT family transporter [Rubrobacteraceae bacterium]
MDVGEGRSRASLWVEVSLLMTVFFFGTNFVAVKYVVDFVPPLLFAAVRFTVAGVVLWLILRAVEPQSRIPRKELLPIFGLGVVGITLTQSVFTIGVSLTTAANTALIYSTAPVWGMLLGFFLTLERPRLSGIIGVGLCLAGVTAIVYGGLEFGGTSLAGDVLILAAAIFWGSYTVLSLSLLRRHSPLAVATYSILLGGLAIFPLAAVGPGQLEVGALGVPVWGAALYSTVLSSGFGFAAWQRGVSQVGANRVLVYQYLVALTGVIAGIVLLGEAFGYQQAIGAAVVLAGVYLARKR